MIMPRPAEDLMRGSMISFSERPMTEFCRRWKIQKLALFEKLVSPRFLSEEGFHEN